MSPSARPRRNTIIPTWAYVVASIFLFVAFMTIAEQLIFVLADAVEMPAVIREVSGGFVTEHMVVAAFMAVVIILGFWMIDLLFAKRR